MLTDLYSKKWDFTLHVDDNKMIITVVFYDFVDYFRSFVLLPEELPTDFEMLKVLSEIIRTNYDEYKDREIIPAIIISGQNDL